jgi:carbamoylphosphate synthase small subunit
MPTNIEIRNISEINPDSIVLSRGPGLFSHEAVNYFIDSSEAVVLTPKAPTANACSPKLTIQIFQPGDFAWYPL